MCPRPGTETLRTARWVSLFLGWGLVLGGVGWAWSSGALPEFFQTQAQTRSAYFRLAEFGVSRCHGVRCQLCPRRCFLPESGQGWCRVRVNQSGRLWTQVYGRVASVHVDPIEKKPVFHFLPGSRTFSLATAGCNLECDFCQNWGLSQSSPEALPAETFSPEAVVQTARELGCRSIAFTYSEPIVFYEYMRDIAREAHRAGLYTIMISAGYIEPEPLKQLLPYLDVVKIDLKSFDARYYRRVVGGELAPVLRTLKIIAASDVALEVVNLIVPSQNDRPESVRALAAWMVAELGADTPLFFSRFTPGYKMLSAPVTPAETLRQARRVAREAGLHYVYVGNLTGDEGENTYCPHCEERLIQREGFAVLNNRLDHGRCPRCHQVIPGIWD